MKPTFPTLSVLTAISIVLVVPFILSDAYLPLIRDTAFYTHQILRRGLYKEITGVICLGFFCNRNDFDPAQARRSLEN